VPPAATITTTDIVAIAGVALAVLALGGVGVMWLALRRLRAQQSTVLGGGEARDVVAYVVALEQEVGVLRDYLEDVAGRLDGRVRRTESRLNRAFSRRALVRYDAYGEMSGRQSLSLALLDASSSGVILSSILHRDAARLYIKEVRDGRGDLTLSPEEEEVLRLALEQDA
jgi:hypothetical protein